MPNPDVGAVAAMPTHILVLTLAGAFGFGLVVGLVTHRTLRRTTRGGIGDLMAVIGVVGGSAAFAQLPVNTGAFGVYCSGLALGFFGYLWVAWKNPTSSVADWMGEAPGEGLARVHYRDVVGREATIKGWEKQLEKNQLEKKQLDLEKLDLEKLKLEKLELKMVLGTLAHASLLAHEDWEKLYWEKLSAKILKDVDQKSIDDRPADTSTRPTEQAPRVLNANFAGPPGVGVLGPTTALVAGQEYDLLVDVGPRWIRSPAWSLATPCSPRTPCRRAP